MCQPQSFTLMTKEKAYLPDKQRGCHTSPFVFEKDQRATVLRAIECVRPSSEKAEKMHACAPQPDWPYTPSHAHFSSVRKHACGVGLSGVHMFRGKKMRCCGTAIRVYGRCGVNALRRQRVTDSVSSDVESASMCSKMRRECKERRKNNRVSFRLHTNVSIG
jgi:hypothetical protein